MNYREVHIFTNSASNEMVLCAEIFFRTVSTPSLDCGYSPADLLMNRRLRTRLPDPDDLLPSEKITSQTSQKQAQYYNVGAKELAPLLPGDSVRVRSDGEWRTKAVVEGQSQSPRSYIIKTEAGKHPRRNRQHLLHTKEKAPDDSVAKESGSL